MRRFNPLFLFIGFASQFAMLGQANADPPQTFTHDVAFKVGTNAQINWFEIDNPSVGGTITVANQPYPNGHGLNAAVVDPVRNRLMYIDDSAGTATYAFDLTNLVLVPNTATSVTISSLGNWPGGNDNAGYRKADGRIYYHVYNSDEVRYLNFDAGGNISGFTSVGTLNGSSFTTPSITAGDLDFDSTGKMWVTGLNSSGGARLWSFDSTTLTVAGNHNPPLVYSGIAFDAAGTTLYGYGYTPDTDAQYGTINLSTGEFQTVLDTDNSLFKNSGDLAETIGTIAVPEPSTAVLALDGCIGNFGARTE